MLFKVERKWDLAAANVVLLGVVIVLLSIPLVVSWITEAGKNRIEQLAKQMGYLL